MNSPHPVASLATSCLQRVLFWPHSAADGLWEAACQAGAGIDHLAGEQVLALRSNDLPRGYIMTYIATDRRVVGRTHSLNVSDTMFDVPYALLQSVAGPHGMFETQMEAHLVPGVQRVFAFEGLKNFLEGLVRIPPEQRSFPPLAVAPSVHDPTAVQAAAHRALAADARIHLLFSLIYQGHAAGLWSAENGFHLTMPTLLADHSLRAGPSAREGFWLVSTPRVVLGALLPTLLGQPLGAWSEPLQDTYDFAFSTPGAGESHHVVSNAIGFAFAATLGVGWRVRKQATRAAVQAIRVVVCDRPPLTGVAILGSAGGGWQPLAWLATEVLQALLQALLALDLRMLLLRATFGPTHAPIDLLNASRAEIEAAVAARIGPQPLDAFFS